MRENNLMTEKAANFFEETSLIAVHLSLFCGVNLLDVNLLIAELPEILKLNYPAVKDIRTACIEIIPQMLDIYRSYDANSWKNFVDLQYLLEMLKNFDDVKK